MMVQPGLKAGVLEDGTTSRTTEGTPQGGVISPLLTNIYLHYMLDEWFETAARPRLKGRCILVRYADDAVMAFEDHLAAKRALAALGKRLGRYGLTLHPDKTRFVDFRFKRPDGNRHPATGWWEGTSPITPFTGNGRRIRWYLHQVERIWKTMAVAERRRKFPVDPPTRVPR
jgi:hypothetical protein